MYYTGVYVDVNWRGGVSFGENQGVNFGENLHMRYSHLSVAHKQKAVNKLDSLGTMLAQDVQRTEVKCAKR
jgi:hypothetical protein